MQIYMQLYFIKYLCPFLGSSEPNSHAGVLAHHRRRFHWKDVLDPGILALPRTPACFEAIEGDCMLDYDLPRKPGMLPGQIMKHCIGTLDRMLEAQKPCIYKVGFTHNPHWRMHNPMYGYALDVAKWEKLVVIYASTETTSPSFVEAALIQRQKGPSYAKEFGFHPCSLTVGSIYIYIDKSLLNKSIPRS